MDRVAIIGAGLMGHGLALVFARGGHQVTITDAFPQARASVLNRVAATLTALGQPADPVALITVADDLPACVAQADIIIEAAPEKLDLKQRLFAELEAAARPDAILASNTSVIPIGQIAARITSKARVCGTHWWNPPYLVPLVEVIETEGTAPETISRVMALLTTLGKTPVHVRRDVPGFVGNRLQHALWREAIALVETGVCDAETIDLVVKSSFGRRLAVLGPLENADLIGTDLALDIQTFLTPHLNNRAGPSPYLEALNAEGRLGFKTGQGFRTWTPDQQAALRAKVLAHVTAINKLLED